MTLKSHAGRLVSGFWDVSIGTIVGVYGLYGLAETRRMQGHLMNDSLPIRVLVNHADPLAQAGLQASLREDTGFEVIRTPSFEGLRSADIIVADFEQGLQLLAESRLTSKALRVLIVTTNDRECDIRRALKQGARGYLLQGCSLDELAKAVREASGGTVYVGSSIAQRLAESIYGDALTPREEEVLQYVVDGLCNKEIATRLDLAGRAFTRHPVRIQDIEQIRQRATLSDSKPSPCAGSQKEHEMDPHQAIEKPEGIPGAVYWLALGAFAIGTEGFMISPLLPGLAQDFGISIEAAGQLVTVFALAYGFSSPVLTALTGSVNRRSLLLTSIVAFALSNLVAAMATTFWGLMAARVLLALSAGLFVPGANALAGVVVRPELRGRSIAVVNGGITVAIALGVPLGALIGHHLGWRMTFVGVAVLAAIATAGIQFGVPKGIGAGVPVASLRERALVAARPAVLATLLSTSLWATGAYTVYTYLSPLLTATTGIGSTAISAVMFIWGFSAAIGVFTGGALADRVGPMKVIVPSIALMAFSFWLLSLSGLILSPSAALWPVLAAIVVWGIAHWAFYPAQQARLIELAGVSVAPIVLSLNASFMYIGFSMGAALGGLTLAHGGVGGLGWVAGACELASVSLVLLLASVLNRAGIAARVSAH